MHADLRRRLNSLGPVYIVQMNHGRTAMGIAFTACLEARLTPYAAGGIDDEDVFQAGVLRWLSRETGRRGRRNGPSCQP